MGSGRFAAGLGIGEGLDSSEKMLQIAAGRGLRTWLGTAGRLPFADGSLGGVLLALALCFIEDPAAALRECRRVLAGDGVLLLGIVPADSPWGQLYGRKKAEGHRIYASATLHSVEETIELLAAEGFVPQTAAGAGSVWGSLPWRASLPDGQQAIRVVGRETSFYSPLRTSGRWAAVLQTASANSASTQGVASLCPGLL